MPLQLPNSMQYETSEEEEMRHYTLNDLVKTARDEFPGVLSSEHQVLRLFGDAHFERRGIPNVPRRDDTSQLQVLSIGNWGRNFEDPCWATIINNQLKFYYGSGKVLQAPKGAGVPPYPYYRGRDLFYEPHNTTPFKFVRPGDTYERAWPEARALLDALIKFLYLREGIVDEVDNSFKGDLSIQFTALCARLLKDGRESSPVFRGEEIHRASNVHVKHEPEDSSSHKRPWTSASPQDHAAVERRTKVPRIGPSDEDLMNGLLQSFNEKVQSENEIERLKVELARAEQKRKDDLARMQQEHNDDKVERRQEAEGQLSAAKAKTILLVEHVKAKAQEARKTARKDEKKAAKSKATAETLKGICSKVQELVEAQDRIEI